MAYNLLINGIYWDCNPDPLILTSYQHFQRDIQVHFAHDFFAHHLHHLFVFPCLRSGFNKSSKKSDQSIRNTVARSEIRQAPPGMYKTLKIMGYLSYQLVSLPNFWTISSMTVGCIPTLAYELWTITLDSAVYLGSSSPFPGCQWEMKVDAWIWRESATKKQSGIKPLLFMEPCWRWFSGNF